MSAICVAGPVSSDSVPVDPIDGPIFALGPRRWFRPTSVDVTGSKTISFKDLLNPARLLTQPTDASRAGLPAAEAGANGQLAVLIQTASSHQYNSNEAPSAWKLLHDGSGMEEYFVCIPTVVAGTPLVFGTRQSASPGHTCYLNSSATGSSATNDAGTTLFNHSRAASLTANTKVWLRNYWQDGGGTPECGQDTNLGAGSSSDITPGTVAADPEFTFRLGIGGGVSVKFLDYFVFPRKLTTPERAIVATYMTARYAF